MANFFERMIGTFSPERMVRREMARLRVSQIVAARMAYDGASRGRRTQGWRAVSSDANSEIGAAGGRLRDVARDLVRNNAHAARAVNVITNNVIGSGIIPSVVTKRDNQRKPLEDLLKSHFDTTDCDTEGRHDLYGLQALAMRTIIESGEVIIRMRPRRASDGLTVPFQMQVMEPDFLDVSKDGQLSNGNTAIQGIEFNPIGQIVAYWLFRTHPGSSSIYTTGESSRIPAEYIAHAFYSLRPHQARGVSWFAPVIVRMRDLADFSDAHLMRQKIAACFAAFIRSDEVPDGAISSDGRGPYSSEVMSPGMIERLKPGEEVSFGDPPSVGDYGEYTKSVMREIAAGLGVSYEALTGDLSNVNFSSGRMGWLEFQRSIDAWRNYMLVPQLLSKIGTWFLNAAALENGRLVDAKIVWTAPRREMIAPNVEVPAIKDAIRAGLTSRSNEQRKLGFDPDDLEAEIAADNQRADRENLVFDSDPRRVTSAGQAVTPTGDAVTPA